MKYITVYLGSRMGADPCYAQWARELGNFIVSRGCGLVYGGSRTGLMGILADAVLSAGGPVIGVEPDFFMAAEVQHQGLTQLIVTKDMAERKEKMMELGDMFLAFPGGIGTLEEISEVMSQVKLGKMDKPFGFLNFGGFYDPLRTMLDHMVEEEFLWPDWREKVHFFGSIKEIEDFL